MAIIESIIWGLGFGVFAVLLAGLRRLPWQHAGLVGLGSGLVLAALRLAAFDAIDAGALVLISAVGGSLATVGVERGERVRIRRSVAVLESRATPPN